MLLIFVGMGLAAPLLTPYNPVSDVNLAQPGLAPTWLVQLSGQPVIPYIKVPTHYHFDNPTDLQEWQRFTTPGSGGPVSIAWNGTDGYIPGNANNTLPGSVQITYNRNTNTTYPTVIATMETTFNWPTKGQTPSTFDSGIFYKAKLEGGVGYSIALLIDDPSGTEYTLYNSSYAWMAYTRIPFWGYVGPTYQGNYSYRTFTNWNTPSPGVDSRSIRTQEWFNQSTTLDAIHQLFKSNGEYTFKVQARFFDTNSTKTAFAQVTMDDLYFEAKGNSWGLLGTDLFGRDQFSQLLYGARQSLIIGVVSSLIAVGIGLLVGVVAGYIGGSVDNVLMRITDVFLTIPFLPLVLVLTVVLANTRQNSILNLIIVLGVLGWSGVARVIRSQVLTVKELSYVEAAKAIGAGEAHIITKHIVPNVSPLIWVNLALFVPGAIVTEAAISFLGLGDFTSMSWGLMLFWADQAQLFTQWWRFVPPGVCIALVSLAFVLIGFSLDSILNPRLRGR